LETASAPPRILVKCSVLMGGFPSLSKAIETIFVSDKSTILEKKDQLYVSACISADDLDLVAIDVSLCRGHGRLLFSVLYAMYASE